MSYRWFAGVTFRQQPCCSKGKTVNILFEQPTLLKRDDMQKYAGENRKKISITKSWRLNKMNKPQNKQSYLPSV